MTKFRLVGGDDETDLHGAAPEIGRRPQPQDNDDANSALPVECSEAAFRAACASFDDSAFGPEPLDAGFGDHVAREFYKRITEELPRIAKRTDLRIPGEFHSLLWLITRLGADQKFIARDQSVAQDAVSRWVCAGQTPGRERRRGIIASGLVSLQTAISEQRVVPRATFTGRRSFGGAGDK
jgi:hypothetical protein